MSPPAGTHSPKTLTFDLKHFKDKSAEAMIAIARASVEDVLEDAQRPVANGGRMPVLTGILRNSLTVDINGTGRLTGDESYILKAPELELGDIFHAEWTAEYAAPVEFGFTRELKDGRQYTRRGGGHFVVDNRN